MAADGNSDVRMATLTLLLDPRKERPEKHIIENDIRAAMATLPGTRSKVGFGASGEKYQLVLVGDDQQLLSKNSRSGITRFASNSRHGKHHFQRGAYP